MEKVKKPFDEPSIDLLEVIENLLSRWVPIVIIGLLGAILAGVGTHFLITKKYTATVSMYVYANPKVSESGTATNADLVAADNLIKTYQVIVKSNAVLKVVADRLNAEHPEYAQYGVTAGRIKGMTSVSVPSGTKILEVAVVTVDPQLSADLANTIAQYIPDEIVRITKAGGVEIVDYASAPKSPSSPNVTRNISVGFVAGLLAAGAYFVLRTLLDTTIYSEEEVAKVTECPVIGSIPHVEITGEDMQPWNVYVEEEIEHGS